MGIAIHYKGKMDQLGRIPEFIDEMTDIAKTLKWKYDLIDPPQRFPAGYTGIVLTPHENCEPLAFVFDDQGYLNSFLGLVVGLGKDENNEWSSTKTQFAPLEVHMAIIKLLHYIQSKYISDLEVMDEADYWETGDKEILKQKMDFLAGKIEMLGDILDANNEKLGEAKSVDDLADRIEELLRKFGFKKN